jgi:hypothetical protein
LGDIFRDPAGDIFQGGVERLAQEGNRAGRAGRAGRSGGINLMRWVLLLVFLSSAGVVAAGEREQRAGNPRGYETDILLDTFGFGAQDIDADIEMIFQGCPRRDCIPSIDQPEFIPTAEVGFLDADDLVLSITHSGETRAYPTRILDRHEIVNDHFGDTPLAVTYCPLCGSGLAFVRELDGAATEFGVSGLLHNNDLIMYDRKTHSIWQQITGRSLAGPKRGETLEALPLSMALWADWRKAHPQAHVLSPPFEPSQYDKQAYADYASSERLMFPVGAEDARLHVKKVIYGLELENQPIAVDSEWLEQNGSWSHEMDGATLSLQFDEAGGVRGFLNGKEISVHRMYWFAWYSFHPGTSLINEHNH